jgi:hypothetical protein
MKMATFLTWAEIIILGALAVGVFKMARKLEVIRIERGKEGPKSVEESAK